MLTEIGTDSNPIILTPELHVPSSSRTVPLYERRSLLHKHSIIGDFEENDLNEVKYETDRDYFVSNIISNTWLNHKEVKIAIYLYSLLDDSIGNIFKVCSMSQNSKKVVGNNEPKLGECGYLTLESGDRKLISCCAIKEVESLSDKIYSDLGFTVDGPRLTGILRKLHRFSYITLTDINYWNTKNGLNELKLKYKKKGGFTAADVLYKTSSRSVFKHVRISKYMIKVWVSNKWVNER